MVDTFHSHIRDALADPVLQSALDTNAENRLRARVKAKTSLPEDWMIMRERAHDVRAKTIANLDLYLAKFIARTEENGIIVHRANDAAEAVQIVLEIAQQNGAQLVAKSKTMVSEEIGLNHALISSGIEVVETDLGEYIVQLRDEPPAHIITPAVHLTREQVGETFHQKLGVPFTNDIKVMTSIARRELRQAFLNADIGISGVNFGVAETGTICMVTNEGNGRMVTTIPPVHVALMGIERLVPSMDDLSLMLALLPRSATGQKITVYVNLIHGPRRSEDADGPRERHLVLVDNGRTDLRKSPLSEALLCIRCGACLNACPVFREIGGHSYVNPLGKPSTYPGPIGSVVSPGLFGHSEYGQLARASSLCGACKEACPVDIDLPKLLLRVRAGGMSLQSKRAESKIPITVRLGMRIFAWLATQPKRFAFSQRSAGILSIVFSRGSGWLRMPGLTGWGISKDLPKPAHHPFRDWWADRSSTKGVRENSDEVDRELTGEESPSTQEANDDTQLLIEKFSDELTELNGHFIRIESLEGRDSQIQRLGMHILSLLREKDISSIMSWQKEQLPDGLIEYLLANGIQIVQEATPTVKAGLTGAFAAVAETGTLALRSGPQRLQAASLLPEVHLVVLDVRDIYRSMDQVLQLEEISQSAAVSLISGPSRTADIEMTLTLGVHGPKEVYVFCLNDGG
ncbi:MAG: LutB/LldF family L-lactate oxidation iron-sulfur protein [Anaerolineales bacterium]|nr:LutB/LldF family L-lactate oxidation iron-sulfur protein [Anaerolineales bacterium]